jgi:hypothetical protein
VLDSMDTDSFIKALWRFISYRCCPKIIYSHNATNIVAGEKELALGIATKTSYSSKWDLIIHWLVLHRPRCCTKFASRTQVIG